MDLYSYVSIESFVRGCKESKTPGTFTLHVPNLLYAKSDEVIGYGLSLLRRSIVLHEEQKGIGPELSKQNIPFFRENRRMLIGPEVEMYALSLYQNLEIPSGVKEKDTSCLRLTFDYGALGEYSLSEEKYLLRCKYNEEENLNAFVSQMRREYDKFFYTISRTCIPRYIATEADPAKIPEGLTLSSLPENWTPVPNEVGILYKLQSIQTMVRSFGEKNENELVNGFGYYLGLLPTWGASSSAKPQDYCSDTHKYYGNDNEGYNKNQTAYKLVGDCFFLAENIMDDPVGVHRSVSQQQAQRMRWILNNSPERSAWKSDYAFTGR